MYDSDVTIPATNWFADGRVPTIIRHALTALRHPLWLRIVSFDLVALLLHPMDIAAQKASMGMYSGCNFQE